MRQQMILILLPLFFTYYSSAQNKIDSVSPERNFRCGVVRTDAEFENGPDDWKTYLKLTINHDLPKQNGCPSGKYTVRIIFVVSKDGKVTQAKATTNLGYGMEKEVIRVINNSPKWRAATQNGRIVNAYKSQLITFDVCESVNFDLVTKS